MTATTPQDLAAQAHAFFEARERGEGERFTTTRYDSPEWLRDLVHEAHGEFLPDDWRYSTIHNALVFIAENPGADDDSAHEFADTAVDVYSADRLAWLASNLRRLAYVDEAVAEYGPREQIIDNIGIGQYGEAFEIYASIYASLDDRAALVSCES